MLGDTMTTKQKQAMLQGQLKKVLSEDVLTVLEKYGVVLE